MIISSRTPEGTPNHCPICNNDLCIEPSLLTRDAPCPHCGSLLWFNDEWASKGRLAEMAALVLRIVTTRFGPPTDAMRRAVETMDNEKDLEKLVDRVLSCRSWEELLPKP